MNNPVYIDPNNASVFTTDPGSPGPGLSAPHTWSGVFGTGNYVYGHMGGTVDTTQLNANVAPGDQQKSFTKLVHEDGTSATATANTAVPKYPHQVAAPAVGGYYNSADSANSSGL